MRPQRFASVPVEGRDRSSWVYLKIDLEDVRRMDAAGPWVWDPVLGDAISSRTGATLGPFLNKVPLVDEVRGVQYLPNGWRFLPDDSNDPARVQ